MTRFGAARYNLYGQGFGATTALALMRDHPEPIRAVVLDAPTLPNVSGDRRTLAALSRLLRLCRADADCGRRYPDAARQFVGVVEQLGRQPVIVGGQPVTPDRFFSMVAGGLTDQAKLGGIPAGLDAAVRGDWTTAGRLLQRGADIPEGVEMARLTSIGQALSFRCPGPTDWEAADTVGWPPAVVRLLEARARLRIGQCAVWGVPKQVDERPQLAVPDLPILVAVGEGDSAGVAVIAATWPNATVMTAPAIGDGSISQSCPRRVMRSFFVAPRSQPDRRCIARMLRVHFSPH
jgi:pimeloyl-ACP methyl ester carboxylesterase